MVLSSRVNRVRVTGYCYLRVSRISAMVGVRFSVNAVN